jgi:polyferredoxin
MKTRRQKIRRTLLALFFLALPVTLNYYSPYLMTQGTVERVATFSLLLWAAVFATSLVLGRSFCGWACPFNGLQQLWESVGVRPLKRVRFLPAVKYALWVAWAAAVIGLAIRFGGWRQVDPLYMTENGVSVTEAGNLITYFMLVGLTLAPAALARRGFCRYFCPFGVWGIVGEKIGHALRIPRLMLRADSSACSGCGSCTKACPMQLPVTQMVQTGSMRTTECFMCETCADVCPSNAISVDFERAE